MAIRIRRGTNADRITVVLESGEVAYTTDTKMFYIGDGTTLGGTLIGPSAAGAVAWGAITGTLASQTDLNTALGTKVTGNTAITGATKTKITYDSKGLVTVGADATTADIAASTNKNYVTDAQQTVITNTSGTNSGNQTLANTSDSTSHTATLSATGGSIKLVEGSNITLTTTGTGADGIITIASTGGGGSGTVTSVAALTLTTTGTDLSSSVATGTTTPIITLNVPDASATARGVISTSPQTIAGDKTFTGTTSGITKSMVGLNNVDNTSDVNKPVSTATQTALNLKQNSLTLTTTGSSGAATLTGATLNIPQYSGGGTTWGSITGTLSSQTDLQTALDGKVDENSAITGATKTKITYDAKGLVTVGADATTADIADSLNKRYVNDAQLVVIGNTSGTNTGDNATNSQYSGLATSKQDTLVSGTNLKTINSTTLLGSGNITTGTVTSVGVSMPSAFSVASSPITTSGTIAITGAGVVSQYVRGDGSLANFPQTSGGGSSVSYYLNGSVAQGTLGGVAFVEINKTPIIGAGTDFTISSNGYIESFITDANDPNQLLIPAGNWNFETYFSASSAGGTPSFYVELYKYDGTSLTLIASSSTTPESITGGTAIDLYTTALAVPQTVLTLTDRLAIRFYVTNSGRTITLHTENSHLGQVITTFTSGLTALNGLTAQIQSLATGTTGTDFNISSATATHTFNLPDASASNRGALTSANWSTFNGKESTLTFSSPLSRVTNTISIPVATTSVNGYLSSTDWTTFNGKAEYYPRIQSVSSSATVTPTSANDLVKITAQATGLTIANPTGIMYEGQAMIIRIKDNGTAQTIAFGTNYRAIGVTLPTTTTISKTIYIGLVWNDTDTKFDVLGINTQA